MCRQHLLTVCSSWSVHQGLLWTLCRRDGTIFAYAVSYDWSRGYAEYNPNTAKNYILLHQPQEAEVKSRARVPGRR